MSFEIKKKIKDFETHYRLLKIPNKMAFPFDSQNPDSPENFSNFAMPFNVQMRSHATNLIWICIMKINKKIFLLYLIKPFWPHAVYL